METQPQQPKLEAIAAQKRIINIGICAIVCVSFPMWILRVVPQNFYLSLIFRWISFGLSVLLLALSGYAYRTTNSIMPTESQPVKGVNTSQAMFAVFAAVCNAIGASLVTAGVSPVSEYLVGTFFALGFTYLASMFLVILGLVLGRALRPRVPAVFVPLQGVYVVPQQYAGYPAAAPYPAAPGAAPYPPAADTMQPPQPQRMPSQPPVASTSYHNNVTDIRN